MQPIFSVTICTYNQEKFIAQAIESVLAQKCDVPFEILVGDDCSTDNTRQIIQSYVDQYPDLVIPVYPSQNLGASKNIVNLAEHARGEVLSICDGDDWWHRNDVLQKQWDVFANDLSIGMFCAKAKCFLQQTQKYAGTLGYDGAESFERMARDNRDVAAPTIAFRKDLFLKCISDSSWYIEQNCFYDSIMAYWFAYFSKVRFVDDEVASYRVLENSACHATDMKKTAAYSRRYFSVKWRFLLEHPLDPAMMHELLMKEYDAARSEADWMSENRVRGSKAYKLGEKLTKPFKKLIGK